MKYELHTKINTDVMVGPFQVSTYIGEDGTSVIHIDTNGMGENERGPLCRVYLNDSGDPLWANPDMVG